jgi:hypothetical protein
MKTIETKYIATNIDNKDLDTIELFDSIEDIDAWAEENGVIEYVFCEIKKVVIS